MALNKGALYGAYVEKIDRFFASSKTCSDCGAKNTLLKMSDREWACSECGVLHDRDVNAAINILNWNTEGDSEIYACGQTVISEQLCLFGSDWTKQEAQVLGSSRALKVVEDALPPFFKQVTFGANVYAKGVSEIYFKRDYDISKEG